MKAKLSAIVLILTVLFVVSGISWGCYTPPPPTPDPGGGGGGPGGGGGGPGGPGGGEPIDLTNGAYYASVTDLVVNGRLRNIVIKRHYTGVDTAKVRMDASDFFTQTQVRVCFTFVGRFFKLPGVLLSIIPPIGH